MSTIGKRVQEKRNSFGLSQDVLGEMCGLTRDAIAKIEGGRNRPSVSSLYAISTALETPMEWFVTGVYPSPRFPVAEQAAVALKALAQEMAEWGAKLEESQPKRGAPRYDAINVMGGERNARNGAQGGSEETR